MSIERISMTVPASDSPGVIFIHGMAGDPESTWRGPDPGWDGDTFWPRWLAREYPSLVIWTLGYNAPKSSHPLQRTPALPLPDRGRALLNELDRETGRRRPLVFVAHSYGGLLVKEMLRQDSERKPAERTLRKQTRGVIFLATPNQGALASNALDALLPWFTSEVIKDLQANGSHLREIQSWYREYAPARGIETAAFCENWPLHGTIRLVDETAADPGIPGIEPIGIDADHETITKPASTQSIIYKSVRDLLQEWLKLGPSMASPLLTSGDVAQIPPSRPSWRRVAREARISPQWLVGGLALLVMIVAFIFLANRGGQPPDPTVTVTRVPVADQATLSPSATLPATQVTITPIRGVSTVQDLPTVNIVARHTGPVGPLAWSPRTATLASVSGTTIQLWDGTGQLIGELQTAKYAILGLAWSPDGTILAVVEAVQPISSGNFGAIRFFRFDNPQLREEYSRNLGTDAASTSVAWLGSDTVVVGDSKGVIWPLAGSVDVSNRYNSDRYNSTSFPAFPSGGSISTIVCTEHGNLCASAADQAGAASIVKIQYDMAYPAPSEQKIGKELVTPQVDGVVSALAWSPDGRMLAAGMKTGEIKLWSVQSDSTMKPPSIQPYNVLRPQTGAVRGLAWSPDGQKLAYATDDSAIIRWNRADFQTPFKELRREPAGTIFALRWKDDNQIDVQLWTK